VVNQRHEKKCRRRHEAERFSANVLSTLKNADSRAIENFYVGIHISGVLCQVPVPGLRGAFPRLHLDDGHAVTKIFFHYFMGQLRICRGWATKSCLAHGIHLYTNSSMETDLGLIWLKSNFRATGQTKIDTCGRFRMKSNYGLNLTGYKIEAFLRTSLGREDYYNIVYYFRLSDDRNNKKVKYRVEGNGGVTAKIIPWSFPFWT
jgi:hypothetical protein